MKFIFTILVILGLMWLYNNYKANELEQSYGYKVERTSSGKADCSSLEPDNPYSYGTGHYAGYEWGQNGNYCSGNSTSFIEGCEEYESQDEAYSACLSN